MNKWFTRTEIQHPNNALTLDSIGSCFECYFKWTKQNTELYALKHFYNADDTFL